MNYHFPDVRKQNRFHFIFLLLLKLLSLVLLKSKVQHIPSGEKSLIFGRVSDPCYEAEWRQKKYHWRYTTKWSSVLSHTTLRGTGDRYRFVTAVGTRTLTTCVDSYKCGRDNLGWLTLDSQRQLTCYFSQQNPFIIQVVRILKLIRKKLFTWSKVKHSKLIYK